MSTTASRLFNHKQRRVPPFPVYLRLKSILFVPQVSLAKVDGGTVTKCNFAGDENAGASWTDKIMANKSETGNTNTSGEGEGAGEDEWVSPQPWIYIICLLVCVKIIYTSN